VVNTVKALKDATDIPIGVAISYTPMINDATYKATVLRDFDGVTFDYNMKHGAIVQNDGSLNFANADALVNAAAGLQVFGHALGWHQNQNASYLKTFSGLSGSVTGNELITNGGFEAGLTGWSAFNTNGGATIIATNVTNEIHAGAGAIKVTVPTAYPGSQWNVQLSSTAFATTVGKQYAISYWVKAASAGGSIRLSTGPNATNAQYQGDQVIGTAWQQVTWTITANIASTTVLFDLAQVANTYFLDNVSVRELGGSTVTPQVTAKVDQALGNFITGMVNHYKGKAKAWDVVN
jgi:endo-1,4-beta-xylanase